MGWKTAGAPALGRIRRLLLLENPRHRARVRVGPGESRQTCVYETLSPATGDSVYCVQIANGFGLEMGWAFLRLAQRPRRAGDSQLFVWPTFRGVGVGRLLEEFAAAHARLCGAGEIRLMMNEADAVLGPPGAARLFAESLGCRRCKWREKIAPRRPATVVRTF